MSDLGALVVRIVAEVAQYKADLEGAATSTTDSAAKVDQATSTWQQNMKGVAASMRDTTAASGELSLAAQRILDRYDPLGTKLRSLTSDMATMRREMGDSTADGAIKAFQGLEEEIEKTKGLMNQAGVAGFESFGKVEEGANKSMLATAGAKRELMVLAHEAVSGNFSKMPGSFMVLAEKMDMTALLMSPLTMGIVGIGAAAVVMGVQIAKGAAEQKAMNDALIMTGNYAGTTSDGLHNLAAAAVVTGGSLSEAKKIVTELAATGRYTADQIGEVTTAVIAVEHATGGTDKSVEKLVHQFESLAVQAGAHARYSDTISKAVLKLDDEYHFLTTSVYEQIHGLEAEGKAKEASALATDTFAKTTKDRATEMAADLGLVARAWNTIKETISGAGDAIGNFGKKQTAQKDLDAAQNQVSAVVSTYGGGIAGTLFGDPLETFRPGTVAGNEYAKAIEGVRLAQEKLSKVNADAAKQGENAQNMSKANHALSAIEAEDTQLKIDKMSKLDVALDAYHQHLKDLRASPDPTAKEIAQLDPKTIADHEEALAKKFAEHARQKKDAYDGIAASIDAANQKALIELDTGQKVSAADQLRISIMKQIDAAVRAGTLTVDEKTAALAKLAVAEANTAAASTFIQWQKDEAKAVADSQKAYDALIASVMKKDQTTLDGLDKAIAKQQLHNAEIGKTKEQIDLLKAAQENAVVADLQSEADRITKMLERNDALKENGDILDLLEPKQEEMARITLAGLDQEIEKRKTLGALIADSAPKDAAVAAAKEATAEWNKEWRSVNNVGRSVFEDLTTHGSNMATKIGDRLKKAIADAFYTQELEPFFKNLFSYFTGGPSGAAGASGGSGGSSGLMNMVMSYFGGGSTNAGNGGNLGGAMGGSYDKAALYGDAGYGAMSSGSASSSGFMGIPVIGWIIAGMSASSSAFDQGYRAQNPASVLDPAPMVNDKTLQALGMGPKGAAMLSGSALESQIVDQIFGAHFEDKGSAYVANLGMHGSSSVALRTDTQETGGVFGGGTTMNSAWADADPKVKAYIDTQTKASTDATKAYATALGLSADAVDGYTRQITVSLTGLDAAGQQKAVDAAISGFISDSITSAFGPAMEGLAKEGETSAQTLQRLATNLTTVNSDLSLLGVGLLHVGIDGAATASKIVDAFGGVTNMQTEVTAYYNAFYSSGEKAANGLASLQSGFAALGVTMPTTRAGLRALVDSLDTTTEAGRKTAAGLLALAPAFDAVSASAAQAAQVMAGALADYGTSEEQRNFSVEQIRKGLSDGGVNLTDSQIANASRADARALWQQYTDQAAKGVAGAQRAADAILAQAKAFAAITTVNTGPAPQIGSSGGGGGGVSTALTDWQTATASVVSTMDALRSTLIGTGYMSFSQLQSQYAITLAQANSGDLKAMQDLPKIAQDLVTSAQANSKTAADQALLTAYVIDSMGRVAGVPGSAQATLTIPHFAGGGQHDGGLAIVGEFGPELVNMPRARVHTATETSSLLREAQSSGGNGEIVALLKDIVSRLDGVEANTGSTVLASRISADALDAASHGQRPLTFIAA